MGQAREYKASHPPVIRGRDSGFGGKVYLQHRTYGYRRLEGPGGEGLYARAASFKKQEVVKKMFRPVFAQGGRQANCQRTEQYVRHTSRRSVDYATVPPIIANPVYMGKIHQGMEPSGQKRQENSMVKKRIKRCRRRGELQAVQQAAASHWSAEPVFMQAQDIRRERQPAASKRRFDVQMPFPADLLRPLRQPRGTHHTVRRPSTAARGCDVSMGETAITPCRLSAVEREIIAALRSWYSGYHVRIDATGYEAELDDCRARLDRLAREEDKLKTQLDNARDLVEQGISAPALLGAERKARICA